MRGYIYVNLLLVVLIALGFVLSGGLILSEESSSVGKITERYTLVDKEASLPNQTLQLSSLEFIAQVCEGGGYDIALVIDKSGSVVPYIDQMLIDINSFVDSFSGKSTQFSVTIFSSNAEILIPDFTDNLSMVKSRISSISGGGVTNWQDALIKAKSTLLSASNRPSFPDIVIFASDGNPNTINAFLENKSWEASTEALSAATPIANEIKTDGARIITYGIGKAINQQNLEAISGSIPKVTGDTDVIITDFANFGTALQSLVANICGP